MVFFNRAPDDFTPAGYPGDGVLTQAAEAEPQQVQGLYYRNRVFEQLASQVDACTSGTMPYTALTIDALQSWNERGWKEPHGSFTAVQRFVEKMREEQQEVDDAVEEFLDTGDSSHVIEELGDYRWSTDAAVSNGGGVIADGIKHRLYEYSMGTRQFEDGQCLYPKWYDQATRLATKRGSVTVGEIDDLIADGFYPLHTPAMNRWDNEPVSVTGYVFDLRFYTGSIKFLLSRQYQADNEDIGRVFIDAETVRVLGTAAAETYFRIAYIANAVGGSLAGVVERNIKKVNFRTAHNLVDKADGVRESN